MLERIRFRTPNLRRAHQLDASSRFVRKRRKAAAAAKIALAVFGVLTLIVLFAIYGVPPLARHYAEQRLTQLLGRDVTIAQMAFNPFALRAHVRGLVVHEPRSSQVFVAFDELVLNLEYRSLLRRAPVAKRVTLTRPYVHIARNLDGSYNFSDILRELGAGPHDPNARPARFSLNNIELTDGRIELDDHPKRLRHNVTDMRVVIPFISNLPDVVDVYVQPAFSGRVNGTAIALHGRTKPFKDTLETTLDLNIERLDITRYVEYLPFDLGFQVTSGWLDSHLTAAFVRLPDKTPELTLRGDIGVEKVVLRQRDGKPLLNLAALSVPISGIDLLERKMAFGRVAITSPEVFVRRDAEGRLNWLAALPARDTGSASPSRDQPSTAIHVALTEAAIHDGVVHIADDVPQAGFRSELTGIQVALRELAFPQTHPAQLEASFSAKSGEHVKLTAGVTLDPLSSDGMLEVQHAALKTYAAYYAAALPYRIDDGAVDLTTQYAFALTTEHSQLRLHGLDLKVSNLHARLPDEREELLRARELRIAASELDLARRTVNLGQVSLREANARLVRQANGTLNALPAQKSTAAKIQSDASPWTVTIQRAEADKCRIAFTDRSMPQAVQLLFSDLRLSAKDLSTRKDVKAQITLASKVNDSGSVELNGTLTPSPFATRFEVTAHSLAVVPFQPYFTERVNVLVSSGELSGKGLASFALGAGGAVEGGFNGNLSLANLASVDKLRSEDLLRWSSLQLGGVQYQHAPMSLTIEQVALSDFFARIIIFPEGRLNLQNLVADAPRSAADANAPRAGPSRTTADSSPMPVKIGQVILQGGDVAFTDLFIKPNYSADLSGIGGSVTGLSSQLDSAADVVLRGRFARTAPVEIRGKVNPLIKDLFFDLKATVRDIELGPLTPYSGKYVGYAIEKGKMSFDVAYKLEHRLLTANNRLVLNQLTFGGRIESPQATKLPVLLAVSLLKDRNGVIDVNLPISGSLDDPKFSVGGIVLRIIFNVIEKAVTAPFAMIAHLVGGGGGGGEELSHVDFDSGRAAPSNTDRDKLEKLRTALAERPGLRLDITAHVDAERDREGLQRLRLEQQVKAQKLRQLLKRGASVRSIDEVTIDPKEYETYLRAAYKEATFPKPRNALGFSKDLPREDVEKLLLANTVVTDDDLISLANQRAQAAKDAITRDGKVAPDRVYLLAPKLDDKGDDKRKGSRVEFALRPQE